MKKQLLFIVVAFLQMTTLFAQSGEQLKDDFIRTYNPDGYDGYHRALDIQKQGLSLVSSLKQGLDRNQGLINSFDPSAILADFNRQIQNIEALEANYTESTNSYDFNAGQSIGDNFNAGNYEQGLNEIFGHLGSLEGRKQAERQAAAQKESLRRERDSKMTNAFWKAIDYNNQQKLQYAQAAAFAESLAEEKYFLSFVENLECFGASMEKYFNTSSTYWLNNSCPEPIKNQATGIQNTFVAKDVLYLNIAKRKYKLFEEMGYEPFRDAAIAYTAAVTEKAPSAKLFTKIGDYYVGKSTLLALTNYLTAETYDKNYFSDSQRTQFENIKSQSELEIKEAIETNNKDFLNAFLSSNLDKIISIEGKSVLNYAIQLDQPDAVQIILNKYTKGKPQTEVLNKLQKTIMMAAVYDAPETIERFAELGVPVDFEMKGYRPVEVAEKSISIGAFDYYVENLDDGQQLLQKAQNEGSDLIKCKKLYLMAGFLNPSASTKEEVRKLSEVRKTMGSEKFKEEGFKNKTAYELAILMIDSFEKTKDELEDDIIQNYNELGSNSAQIKVVEALIEIDSYKTLMKVLESDPSKEYLVEKHEYLHKTILNERLWNKAVKDGSKESFTKLLLTSEDAETRIKALKKIKDIKEVPVLIAAIKSNKCGFFDGNGKVAIPFIYNSVNPFHDGLAVVSKNGKWGFIDQLGNVKIPLQYGSTWNFYDGLALVKNKEGKYFSVDINGNKVADFGLIVVIFEGTSLFVVSKGSKEYLMHRNGKMITDEYIFFNSDNLNKPFSSKSIMVKDLKTDKIGFIDYTGKIIVPTKYASALYNFSDDLFFVKKESQGKFGLVNSKNEELTEFIYDVYTNRFGKLFTPHGEAIIGIDGARGYIDSNGNILDVLKPFIGNEFVFESSKNSSYKFPKEDVLKPNPGAMAGAINVLSDFTGLQEFHDAKLGYSMAQSRNYIKKARYGLKRDGIEIIPAELSSIIGFSFDHIKVELEGKTYYVNIQGDIVDHQD